ncbi:MAG: hypothetical protein H0U65_03590 [Rubrobacter sp.]|nr:hypothetical protein [Rubrobacter sp.]
MNDAAVLDAVSGESEWMESLLVRLVEAPTTLGNEEAGQEIMAEAFGECGFSTESILLDEKTLRNAEGSSPFSWSVAPALAGVLLVVILVLGVANFNVLITGAMNAPTNVMAVILPGILFGGGILGLLVGYRIKRGRPEVYDRIGRGANADLRERDGESS